MELESQKELMVVFLFLHAMSHAHCEMSFACYLQWNSWSQCQALTTPLALSAIPCFEIVVETISKVEGLIMIIGASQARSLCWCNTTSYVA